VNIPEPYKSLIRSRYNFLKQQGLENIRKLSIKEWSDYNLHDPGITILEQLCHGIIDLEYRNSFPIADILAENPNDTSLKNKKLAYAAEEILPSNPWSKKDFIKLIADIPGVKNIQICTSGSENEIKGGYKLFLVQEDDEIKKDIIKNTLINNVLQTLHSHRNLCEDFFEVSILSPKFFFIKADLEVKDPISPEVGAYIVAKLLFDIQDFLVPQINFYTLSDMVCKKMQTVEEVYSGPILKHGFVDNDELEDSAIKLQFHLSELANKIIINKQIKSLLKLYVYTNENSNPSNFIQANIGEFFKLDIENSCINLYRNGLPVNVQIDRVVQLYKDFIMMRFIKKQSLVKEEIAYPVGTYKNLSKYYSIQNDFPLIYGVGIEGPPTKADAATKSGVNQLKAFLLIFDQIFANYLSKLNNSKLFLPTYNPHKTNHLKQIPGGVPKLGQITKNLSTTKSFRDTEFSVQRKLLGIEIQNNHKGIYSDNKMNSYYNYLQTISDANDYHRIQINKTLEFTLSIIAENIPKNIIGLGLTADDDILSKTIEAKMFFLDNYIETIKNANKAINLLIKKEYSFSKEDASGFEHRVCRKLNIKNIGKRDFFKDFNSSFHLTHNLKKDTIESFLIKNSLSNNDHIVFFETKLVNAKKLLLRYGADLINYEIIKIPNSGYCIRLYVERETNKFLTLTPESKITTLEKAETIIKKTAEYFKKFNVNSEGFYTVEHILLRTDNLIHGDKDLYSFTVTIALPSWPARFQMKEFRDQFYKTVLEHCPAHILVNILWLDIDEMEVFEKAYNDWIMLKTNPNSDKDFLKNASQNLLGLILMYSNDTREYSY
jgi:hypothetical protein